jgi:hypothetical protein
MRKFDSGLIGRRRALGWAQTLVWDEQPLCSMPSSSKISVGELVKEEKFHTFEIFYTSRQEHNE